MVGRSIDFKSTNSLSYHLGKSRVQHSKQNVVEWNEVGNSKNLSQVWKSEIQLKCDVIHVNVARKSEQPGSDWVSNAGVPECRSTKWMYEQWKMMMCTKLCKIVHNREFVGFLSKLLDQMGIGNVREWCWYFLVPLPRN